MLALYTYIVLDRNKKQNFGIFFVSGYQIISYGLMALNETNNKKKYLKEYAEYNTFDYQTYNMHMTCEHSVVTSNLYKKSSHFALF